MLQDLNKYPDIRANYLYSIYVIISPDFGLYLITAAFATVLLKALKKYFASFAVVFNFILSFAILFFFQKIS